jgi:hypothetical protein
MRQYKFTLAVENAIWPGYVTEKLVHPMHALSVPIYLGDPNARASFDASSYVDITSFGTLHEVMEYVREVDNDRNLYRKILAAPFYRGNEVPDYARPETVLSFLDRALAAALSR